MKRWKCCDFQPFLANFLIGAILESEPEFSFTGAHHWQPLGLIPSHEFRKAHGATDAAAREENLVCQFYVRATGGCGIWNFRPGECSHYFCEGATPELDAGSSAAFAVETAVAQKALYELGYTKAQVGCQIDLLNDPGDFPVFNDEELRKIYRASWCWARNLNANDVRQWL